MKSFNHAKHRATRHIVHVACAAALAAAVSVSTASPAHAHPIVVPALPQSLEVLPPNRPFLLGRAEGTQNYVCLPVGVDGAGMPTFGWKLFTPEATLFNGDTTKQVITHFFSPNPDEVNTDALTGFHPIRAAWQSSKDTSTVWARTLVASDAVIVTQGAIPWLKLTVVGSQNGGSREAMLMVTTFIQRVNTTGGVAPAADTCDSTQEVGRQAYVPYTADYIFYTDQ